MNWGVDRVSEIDALRGVGIFMVVFGHSMTILPVDTSQIACVRYLHSVFWDFHMYLFFVLSGLCFSFVTYFNFVKKKFIHLMVPYYVFNMIDMVPRACFNEAVSKNRSVIQSIRDTLLSGGDYWFLMTLFIVLSIYPFVYRFMSGKRSAVIATVVVILASVSGVFNGISVFTLGRVAYYMLAFHSGVLLRRLGFSFAILKTRLSKLFCPIMIFLFIIIHSTLGNSTIFGTTNLASTVLAVTGVFSTFLLCAYKTFEKLFCRFGAWSLQIYLMSKPVIFFTRNAIPRCLNIWKPEVIYLTNFVFGFIITYLAVKYLVFRNRYLRVLMGG